MAELTFRCPELACTGWVSLVEDDDETFWGCGECGTVWFERDELDQAITDAIEKYPYRKKCYRKTRNGWNPVPLEKEPDDYEELVEQEWDDEEEEGELHQGGEDEYPYEVDESWLRCPVTQCSGWVAWMEESCFDSDRPAWQCDCCGGTWYEKKNLLKEIEAIAAKFAYRQACYIRSASDWKPAPVTEHASGYEDLVEAEPEDTFPDYERG